MPGPTPAPPEDEYSDLASGEYSDLSSGDLEELLLSEGPSFSPSDSATVSRYALSVVSVARQEFPPAPLSPASFAAKQTALTAQHREVAVTRILAVLQQYGTRTETFFQATAYLNSVLAFYDCPPERLMLFGLTCLWIAAKFEEKGAPRLSDLCAIAGEYEEAEFVECECFILRIPGFRLTFPTVPLFLQMFLDGAQAGEKAREAASFLAELSAIPIDFVATEPWLIAMACVCLGQMTTGGPSPAQQLMAFAGVDSLEETGACCAKLITLARRVLEHPTHFLYLRYTQPPGTGVILEMQLTEDLIGRLGQRV
jgi:hypothetical protein